MFSRRRFLSFLVAGAAAATAMPALEKALASVEPMLAAKGVSRLGGAYLDMGAASAMLKEFYSDERVENLAYDDCPLLVSRMPNVQNVSEVSGVAFVDWSTT